jgi:hypothetical protein
MNCQEVQAQLSDYVDLSLKDAQVALVHEHLAICSPCREEAELLGETIREVAALPVVETPLGFTQRVMSHVREIDAQPTFWQRFFIGKIPARATALVAVGIFAVYLLQTEEPHRQSAPAPESTTTGSLKQESTPPKTVDAGAPSAPASSPVERSPAQLEARITTSEQARSVQPLERRRRAEDPAPPTLGNAPLAASTVEPTVRATPIISGTTIVTSAPAQPGNAPAAVSVSSEPDIMAHRSTGPIIEPFADLELVLRRHAAQPAGDGTGAMRKTESNQGVAERQTPPRPIDRLMAAIPDRTRPQTIWINVPENQYEDFKKELNALGIIESEIRVPLLRDQATNDGHIRVKLTALPAAEAAPSNSATGR